jgi:hypothetical protein
MIFDLIKVFTNIRSFQHFYADDHIDKLNRSTTVIILIISILLVSAKSALFGPVISCIDDYVSPGKGPLAYIESMWYVFLIRKRVKTKFNMNVLFVILLKLG